MDLQERCEYATRVRADVFVSIHLNSAADTDSSGIETHILPPAGHPITASDTVGPRDRAAYPGNSHDGANLVLGYSLQRSLLKYGPSGLRVGSSYRLWYAASKRESDDAGHRVVREAVGSGHGMAGS